MKKSTKTYRFRLLLPILAGLILLLLLGLVAFTRTPKTDSAASARFVKAPLFSGWDYQTQTAGVLETSIKKGTDGGTVSVTYEQSSLSLKLPFTGNQLTQTANNKLTFTTPQGITTTYQVEANRIKEEIILDSPTTIHQPLTTPLTTTNLDIYLTPDNLPVFFDSKTGGYRFHIEAPFAIDAAGSKTYAASYQLKSKANPPTSLLYPQLPDSLILMAKPVKVSTPDQQYVLELTVDPAWLNHPDRVYPVTIDPTITHDTQGEFVAGSFNRILNTKTLETLQTAKATGGTITYVDGYVIHTFTSSGTFTPSESITAEVFVVAGGGGGSGSPWGGGGGGAGGVITHPGYSIVENDSVSVVVGSGGAAETTGSNSSFGPLTAFGGGRGYTSQTASDRNGGSGGGAGHMNPPGTASSSIQTNNNGGIGYGNGGGASVYSPPYNCGSGGGAGASGTTGGVGGIGISSTISGTTTYYGGGGGMANNGSTATAGGDGGGGAGRIGGNGYSGTANTGGGGGGSYGGAGGSGGSGIVIIRYYVGYDENTVPSLEAYYQELNSDPYTVGLWHFNETEGNALDSSGNSNTGTPTNTTVVDGIFSNARSINGTTSHIDVTDSNSIRSLNKSFTIETWAYRTGTAGGGNSVLVDAGSYTANTGAGIWVNTSHQISWRINQSYNYYKTNVVLPLQTWTHIAVVYDETSVKIYQDGVLKSTDIFSTNPNSTSTGMRFGRREGASAEWYNGYLDEVRISNIARTPEEIRAAAQRRPSAVYTSPVIDIGITSTWDTLSWTPVGVATGDGETPFSTDGLVAQWNFNETSGTTAASGGSCGATCNGTLTNFADTTGQDVAASSGWTGTHHRWGAGALMFDGSNDHITIPDSENFTFTDFTVEFWINPSKNGSYDSPIGQYDDGTGATGDWWNFERSTGSTISFKVDDATSITSVDSKSILQTGNWYHVVGVRDQDSYLKIFINGIEEASVAETAYTINSSRSVYIGNQYSVSRYFMGTMDSTRIYSRALPASEILSATTTPVASTSKPAPAAMVASGKPGNPAPQKQPLIPLTTQQIIGTLTLVQPQIQPLILEAPIIHCRPQIMDQELMEI
jgi:hypothetical protein